MYKKGKKTNTCPDRFLLKHEKKFYCFRQRGHFWKIILFFFLVESGEDRVKITEDLLFFFFKKGKHEDGWHRSSYLH